MIDEILDAINFFRTTVNANIGTTMFILVVAIIAVLMLSVLFSNDNGGSDLQRSSSMGLLETQIESFDSYSTQDKFEIIEALKAGTARVGRTSLGRMDFDISTGRKIK